jgi:hypothetical protein
MYDSDQNLVRCGPIRCDFVGEKGSSNKVHPTQSESNLQREKCLSGHETRDQLLPKLQCDR